MKFLKMFSLLLFMCLPHSNQSQAATINLANTDTEFAVGNFANLQGLDWLSFDVTFNKTRSQIENGYGGLVNDGWRYATRNETAKLLTSLSPMGEGLNTSNYLGASWLFDIFSQSILSPFVITGFFYGATGECAISAQQSCMGLVGAIDLFSLGLFLDDFGRSSSGIPFSIDKDNAEIASLMVRDNNISNVPLPAAVYLIAAPLLGLIGLSRRKVII